MDPKISELVDKAVSLDRKIRKAQTQLDDIKERLRTAAATDENGKVRTSAKMAGNTVELRGVNGHVAKVSFPKRGLIRTGFWLQGQEAWTYRDDRKLCLGNVIELAGKHFNDLFRKVFKPKGQLEEFKQSCETLVGGDKGRDLAEMFQEDPTPRVSFDTAEK